MWNMYIFIAVYWTNLATFPWYYCIHASRMPEAASYIFHYNKQKIKRKNHSDFLFYY